jgi:intraflagellar transport protein 172
VPSPHRIAALRSVEVRSPGSILIDPMKLSFWKQLLQPGDSFGQKLTAAAFSPNNQRLAVVTGDRVVHLYDENGERRDKFSTKPADKVSGSQSVRCILPRFGPQ